MKEEIKVIYKNTVNDFLSNVDEEKKCMLQKMYLMYLIRKYSSKNLSEKMFNFYIKKEKISWKDFSYDGKLALVTEDKYFEMLQKLSLEGMKAATDYIDKSTVYNVEDANKKIKELEYLKTKVNDFNKKSAELECSEGILDFSYAAQLTDIMSLRTGRYKH